MKFLITLLISSCCLAAMAQQKTTQTNITIDDNGDKLAVTIFANTDKGLINYKNEFDIKGLSQTQKEAIVDHIKDSLGLPKSNNQKTEKMRVILNEEQGQSGNKALWEIAEKFNADQVAHFNKGDLLGVAQFYSDDAIIYHPGKIYQGRDSINKYWTDIQGGKNWTLTIKEVGGDKKSFWVAGVSELTVVNNNVDRTYASNYIVIMQRDKNGEYKIYKDIYNQAAKK